MDHVIECFNRFIRDRLEGYRFGKTFYPEGARPGDQFSQNPYIKTEADLQVKFGGFLERYLSNVDAELVVHAEMPIYADPYARADLTIHRVPFGSDWAYKEQILKSLVSVIGLKLANAREPLFDFQRGGVKKDITLLKSLRSGIGRYILIADEAERVEPLQIQEFLLEAKENQVVIISNNDALMGNA